MQRKMLASIKDNYLIEYIDEPVVAESRISPRRTLIVVASTILGFFSLVILLIFYEFVYKRSEG